MRIKVYAKTSHRSPFHNKYLHQIVNMETLIYALSLYTNTKTNNCYSGFYATPLYTSRRQAVFLDLCCIILVRTPMFTTRVPLRGNRREADMSFVPVPSDMA